MPITVTDTPLAGLKIVQPTVFGDQRGFFVELFNGNDYGDAIGNIQWKQDNLSMSKQGTLRGLHFQAPPHAQAKLVCCLQGCVKDVLVDIRTNSATYGQSFSLELTAEKMNMLLIPEGFAHGFSVLSEQALFYYKCSDYYNKDSEGGLAWDDPQLAIDWGNISEPIISDKDKVNPKLADFKSPF